MYFKKSVALINNERIEIVFYLCKIITKFLHIKLLLSYGPYVFCVGFRLEAILLLNIFSCRESIA